MLQVWCPWLWQVRECGATSCSCLHWPRRHLCFSCMSSCSVLCTTAPTGAGYISIHRDSSTYIYACLHLHAHHPLTRPCVCFFFFCTIGKALPALCVLQLHHSQPQCSLFRHLVSNLTCEAAAPKSRLRFSHWNH